MGEITQDTSAKAHKPLDFVKSEAGSIGYILEVSLDNLEYSVHWIINVATEHNAWWKHNELKVVDNIQKELSKYTKLPFSSFESFI